ncbi:MAG: SLC13 family permease [Christensenellaceae bacterium]|nr:SLC13 family permease [Christensenellaceae bacterium]MEA5066607.1 SLC13 family permease [Eubacteriales bacterium]MEA5069490.1 SLC13 family permease [Christensenellaceae bacterium]
MAWGLLLVTYALLPVFSRYRAYIAPASALLFAVPGILPVGKAPRAVNWNAIMMAAGTMGAVSLFIESKMAPLLADRIIDKMRNVKWAVISLALFAGIISALVDNTATVLMAAPIVIAISSNLQGAVTVAYVCCG